MFVEVAAPAVVVAPRAARPALVRRVLRATPPYLYLLPALALLVIWTYRPLVQTAQLSFFSWNLLPTQPATPVGLGNYSRLFQLPAVGQSVLRTLEVIGGLVPFTILVPLAVGLLSQRIHGRARAVYQALVFAPLLVAPVASATVWEWLLEPGDGVVNRVLGTHVNWLHDTAWAQPAIILVTGWHLIGFAVLVVSAGLSNINRDYAEAAMIDGASRGQITRWITLPLLSPTLVFLALMTVLLSAQWTFPLIDTITQGGPSGATTNVYYLLWDYSFHSFDAGLGTAAGMLLFVAFGIVAAGLVLLGEKLTVHDD
ncbi:carbohydrate ABC transporter permease [Amycolatopsis orientalis]|uniref:carbohydrate ABC transporter permease n=1 Tax=Amycolatopsis orientalis TaxID=31958 RepID=UPI0003A3365B|nr:sugar ABC transporter permease [Amycolatopsis orientalis]